MEGGRERDHFTGAAPQSSGDECSGVELSLRLTTGSGSPPPLPPPAAAVAAEQQDAAPARRSMTIFYNGRVCAVDVTEIQAREIISMANQQLRRDEGHLQNRAGGAMARCGGQVMRPAAALSPAGGPRQGLATVASPVTDQAGLSMKRSLQRFLQKREARRAAAVAPPYAGGGRQAQAMRH